MDASGGYLSNRGSTRAHEGLARYLDRRLVVLDGIVDLVLVEVEVPKCLVGVRNKTALGPALQQAFEELDPLFVLLTLHQVQRENEGDLGSSFIIGELLEHSLVHVDGVVTVGKGLFQLGLGSWRAFLYIADFSTFLVPVLHDNVVRFHGLETEILGVFPVFFRQTVHHLCLIGAVQVGDRLLEQL